MIFWRSWGNNHQHSGILTGACEIKWYRTIDASQLTGLRSFRLDYPDVRCHVVCNVDEPFLRGSVHVMNWKQFLNSLSERL